MKKKNTSKSNIFKKPKTRSIQKEPPKGQLSMGLFAGDQNDEKRRNTYELRKR